LNYFPWIEDDEDDSFAWLGGKPRELIESNDNYLLKEGKRCAGWFPKDLIFDLSPDYGSKLTDSLPNTFHLLVVSEKLKDLLEARLPPESIEFLSIRVRNPKKKPVDKKYFIANVLTTVACVNKTKSKFVMSSIDKSQVNYFSRLVLDEKKISEDAKLFRLAEQTALVIVREDLATDILRAKCNGMMFVVMEEYGAEFRGEDD